MGACSPCLIVSADQQCHAVTLCLWNLKPQSITLPVSTTLALSGGVREQTPEQTSHSLEVTVSTAAVPLDKLITPRARTPVSSGYILPRHDMDACSPCLMLVSADQQCHAMYLELKTPVHIPSSFASGFRDHQAGVPFELC